MKINLGCGRSPIDGWINVDNTKKEKTLNDFPQIKRMDVTEIPWEYEDNIFDYIFTEHMMEHVDENKVLGVLKECYRTLKIGGAMRLLIPDKVFYQQLTDDHVFVKNYAQRIFKRPFQRGDGNRIKHRGINQQGHVWMPTTQELDRKMAEAGFKDTSFCEYNVSNHTELSGLDTQNYPGIREYETICIEGIKT
tara:strand:+ start:10065 stop:10643 length:579 start_codon:yes stop_codon:yes gene_type:complete